MVRHFCWSAISTALLAIAGTMGAVSSVVISSPASAQNEFPDVEPDYWARPFILKLAEQDIIAGYPDGTFRPEKPIDRDEFAAVIRQAFDRDIERTIPSGSVFKDVPEGYWAAPPIEEAYETGFMKGYEENWFAPKDALTRAQALMALTRGLGLSYIPLSSTLTQATQTPKKQPQTAKKGLMFPLASTAIMQPFLLVANAVTPPESPQESQPTVAVEQSTSEALTAREWLNAYYADAEQIPDYAIDETAAATQANIIVNYPQPNQLNPNQLLERGTAAAWIHQSLVHLGQLEPLSPETEAYNYIAKPVAEGSPSEE